MKYLVKYLCILIGTCYCDAEINRPIQEFQESLNIDIPEVCSVYSIFGFKKYVVCPDFTMFLNHFAAKYYGDIQEHHEYSTEIECTSSSYPKYLFNADSSRNSLLLYNCQAPEIGSFGEGWPRLEYLKFISYENDLQLRREHFSGLNNIWYLRLHTSSSQNMPDDVFADLPKLRILIMTVTSANKKSFANLSELESLQLTIKSHESMNNFDTSELKSAPKLKELNLILNNVTRLTKRFFDGCSNIEHLYMGYNVIETIDRNAFKPLRNLKNIVIDNNELATLPAELFSKNKKLEKIKIRSWTLSFIPSGFLSNLTNLREVKIYCNVTSLPNDLFHGSNNLEMLVLRMKQLTSLPRDFFQNHTKLRVVKLIGNQFSDFPDDYFHDKSPLTELTFTSDLDF